MAAILKLAEGLPQVLSLGQSGFECREVSLGKSAIRLVAQLLC